MSLKRGNGWALALLVLLESTLCFAESNLESCWTSTVPAQLIDVDGDGKVSGAWRLPRALVQPRSQQAKAPTGILVPGYDRLTARLICADLVRVEPTQARLVFGGRELLLARQGVPAWEWLMVTAEQVAANLLAGGLPGIFVGDGKGVVGQGLEKTLLTDPARLAARLMETHQAHYVPVVLFVSSQYQQSFFDFFSNNPMPSVFLSFDQAEEVRDVLNKQARISSNGQQGPLDYQCY